MGSLGIAGVCLVGTIKCKVFFKAASRAVDNFESQVLAPGTRFLIQRIVAVVSDDEAFPYGKGAMLQLGLERYAVRYIADATARMNALVSGEMDVINRADLKTIDIMKQTQGLKVEEVIGTQPIRFPCSAMRSHFTDVNVRTASKLAINRQELVGKILLGHGKVANDHPIAPANRYFASGIPQREYDTDEAKSDLKKAGMD